jgi:hypothetical protein
MKSTDAQVVFPDREEPLIDAPGGSISTQALSADRATLTRKRGALPLEAFLEVVGNIVMAHGNAKGVISQ